jgi:hypothetical protein
MLYLFLLFCYNIDYKQTNYFDVAPHPTPTHGSFRFGTTGNPVYLIPTKGSWQV